MKYNQDDSSDFAPKKFVELGSVSPSEWCGLIGIAPSALAQAANQLVSPPPPIALSAGPVAVHVDGVRCFTPTELGQRKGLSAQKFNRLLAERGLQERRDGQWCPTEAGKAFGVLLQVHKKQHAGADVLQLKWKESVLAQLENFA